MPAETSPPCQAKAPQPRPKLDPIGVHERSSTERSAGSSGAPRLDTEAGCAEGRDERSAYRIVQEAFTSVLKHAGPAHARVQVCYGDRELEIKVAEGGRGQNRSSGRGHGLVGRRELLARDVLHRAVGVLGPHLAHDDPHLGHTERIGGRDAVKASNELEPVAVVAHALGMARQNAQRKFSHLPEPNR
jgi:hypothetical protein